MSWMSNLNCMMMMVRKNWRKILNNLMSYMGNLMMSLTCYSLKMS
jgi:hypothetical protein